MLVGAFELGHTRCFDLNKHEGRYTRLHFKKLCHRIPRRTPTIKELILSQRALANTECSCKRRPLPCHANSQPVAQDYKAQDITEEQGRSELHTLDLLEWPRLCSYIAKFASTSIGREELLKLKPARHQTEAEEAQAASIAAHVIESRFAATLDFGGISTSVAKQAVSRAQKGGALTATQLLAVSNLSTGALRLQRTIKGTVRQWGEENADSQMRPLLAAIRGVEEHKSMTAAVTHAISDDGKVKDSASENVSRTRAKVHTIQGRLRNVLKGMKGELSEQGNRMCLSIPAGDSMKGGILLGSSPGRGFQYVEPQAAVSLNNDLAAARGEMYAAEEEVLWRISGLVMEVVDSLQISLDMVIWVDIVVAKARFGRWTDGSYPVFAEFPRNVSPDKQKTKKGKDKIEDPDEDTSWIRLRRLRHPLLLCNWLENSVSGGLMDNNSAKATTPASKKKQIQEKLQGGPVPTDISVKSSVRAVIITGPNTGGKTASLKATGLAVLMAKSGLAIPAAPPVVLPPFSNVLADIGDSQSLQSSLSTFSGHLSRIKDIRREADGKTLVLLDELGTGTEPGQGAALGVAILQAFLKGGQKGAAFTMATTHHSGLTTLKYEDSRFENASVEFDEEKLVPTYKLLWGIPGRSNAINTASRLGLRTEITDAARKRLGINLSKMDSTIQKLEVLRNQCQEDEERAEAMTNQLTKLEKQLAISRRNLDQEQATQQLQVANSTIRLVEQALAKLDRLQGQKVVQEKRKVEERAEHAKNMEERKRERKKQEYEAANPIQPSIGQTVSLPKLKGKGKIVALSGDQATVQIGKLKVNAKLSDLQRA